VTRTVSIALAAGITALLLGGCGSASPWPAVSFPTATPLPGGLLYPIPPPTANTSPSATSPPSDASQSQHPGG
jgi:hypothetical protein